MYVPSSSSIDSTDSFDSLDIRPYRPLLLPGPLDNIQCPHRGDEYRILLVDHKNVADEFILATLTVIIMSFLS